MRKLAHIARKYDKGFGHFTTRTNLQFNWIKLVDVPDILRELASVEMHCIQTSGNCIRNVTADQFAGATDEEIEDPAPAGRDHPAMVEPASGIRLPGAQVQDRGGRHRTRPRRAAMARHGGADRANAEGRIGYKVMAGGGMGRTPYIAHVMSEFVEREDILAYLEAVLRVYNQDSRRDNIHKQRIKILINAIGPEEMRRRVDARVRRDQAHGHAAAARRRSWTASPPISRRPISRPACPTTCPRRRRRISQNWVKTNVHKHTRAGLCHRHHLAEDAGPGAGRRQRRADGRHRRPDGPIQPGRNPRHP